MHKLAKEIMDRVKSKINSSGIDAITEQELIEMKYWTCIADAMTSYDYHFKIIEEMEKPENKYGVNYDENGKFYTQSRDEMGRYMRRPYVHEPAMEQYRDMDSNMGRMYYTDRNSIGSNYTGNNRTSEESRYERARRGYEESKQINPSADNMQAMERVFEAFEDDIRELKPKMTQNEKTIARNKLSNMSNMMM